MQKLTRDSLYSLEQYSSIRSDFRHKVIEHKKARKVHIGPHATLYFEDNLTMQYQVQEMLRIEKIFEANGIEEEIKAYNPLIPDGNNWKATFMIEYDDEQERRIALSKMLGIEDKVWVQVKGYNRVYAVADEDMVRENADKTSSVHFLRFELSEGMIAAVRDGTDIAMGIDHDAYRHKVDSVDGMTQKSLSNDLH